MYNIEIRNPKNDDTLGFSLDDVNGYVLACTLRKHQNDKMLASSGWLMGSFVPLRTSSLREALEDTLIPSTLRAKRTDQKALTIFAGFIWDVATLAVRVITVVPKAVFRYFKPEKENCIPDHIMNIMKVGGLDKFKKLNAVDISITQTKDDEKITVFSTLLSKTNYYCYRASDSIDTLPKLDVHANFSWVDGDNVVQNAKLSMKRPVLKGTHAITFSKDFSIHGSMNAVFRTFNTKEAEWSNQFTFNVPGEELNPDAKVTFDFDKNSFSIGKKELPKPEGAPPAQ